MRARYQRRHAPPFARIVLGVRARDRDVSLIERMGRLATRLSVELRVVHVGLPGATPNPEILERLQKATRVARGQWHAVEARDPAAALIAAAKELDTIVVESPRGKQRLFSRPSFANLLLRAGAREFIALAPRP
jgi:K+-sensing histidine kinase KdpD